MASVLGELHTEVLQLQKHRRSLLKDPDEMERADTDMSIAESLAFIAYDDLRLGNPDKAVENYLAADPAFLAAAAIAKFLEGAANVL